MAGHSHWANISAKKGVIDKKRGKLFGMLSRAIIVAARTGGGDPVMNLRLRYAIDKAKAASMPKDTIERAVKKGCGELDGDNYEGIIYEGYGPGGTAVLCDILTDNRNRTAGEIRKIFEVHGGNLGSTNCVAWMFARKGVLQVARDSVSEEKLFELALEAGADDVKQEEDLFFVYCSSEGYPDLESALQVAEIPVLSGEITLVPQNTVDLSIDDGRRMLGLLEALEDQEDVQTATANCNIPNEVLQELNEA